MNTSPSMKFYIWDQPRALKEIWNHHNEYTDSFSNYLADNQFKKIYLLGGGTSLYDGFIIKYMINNFMKTRAEAIAPALFTNHECVNPSRDWDNSKECVIAISITGTSVHSIMALKKAKELGMATVAITANENSAICQYADFVLKMMAEQEVTGPETRGYTVILATGYLATLEAGKKMGTLSDTEYKKYMDDFSEFVDHYEQSLKECDDWYNRNKKDFIDMKKIAIAGCGVHYGTAMEGRLKLFETFSRGCTYYEMEEMIHGPMRAYDENNYLFFINSDGSEHERMLEIYDFVSQLTNHIYVVGGRGPDENNPKDLDFSFKTNEYLQAIQYVGAFHLLSCLVSKDVGIDVDDYPLLRLKKQPIAHLELNHLMHK